MYTNSPYSFKNNPQKYFSQKNGYVDHQLLILQSKHSSEMSILKYQLERVILQNKQLQKQLQDQKMQIYQLRQVRRKTQEQFKRMEFQISKIEQSQNLQNKEILIKSTGLSLQNQRISKQLHDVMEELSKLRQIHRNLQSEHNKLLKEHSECKIRNQEIQNQNQYHKDVNWQTQANKQFNNTIQQFNKTNKQFRTLLHEHNQLKNQFDKLSQKNTKLTSSYQQLKRNHKNLENNKVKQIANQSIISKQQNTEVKVRKVGFKKEIINEENSTKVNKVTENPNIFNFLKTPDHSLQKPNIINQNPGLLNIFQMILGKPQKHKGSRQRIQSLRDSRTSTKSREQKIVDDVTNLRKQLIDQLLNKYYNKSIDVSKKKKSNCLKEFIMMIQKNLSVLKKMSNNYIEAKNSVEEEIKRQIQDHEISQDWAGEIFTKVQLQMAQTTTKQGIHLGIFRLLTILAKIPPTHPIIPLLENQIIKAFQALELSKETKKSKSPKSRSQKSKSPPRVYKQSSSKITKWKC